MDKSHIDAHSFSVGNRRQLENDSVCGCFFCLEIFAPHEIEGWILHEEGDSAVCPYCAIDAIIGESSGYPMTKEFLNGLKVELFGMRNFNIM